jgi:tetraacyldisaccharide 4'-kinase
VSLLLRFAECPYRGYTYIRRAFYRAGLLRAKQLPHPVLSIGNISAGGAGKTPATIRIARHFLERGFRVAVLTRGYGREGGEQGLVTSRDTARFGDEPVLIKTALANVDVIVGSSRYANAVRYLGSNDCDLFILDDGFQHLQLTRDVDVVIDVPEARFWREGRSALRDADVLLARDLRPLGWEPLRGRPVFAFAGLADNEQFFAMLRGLGLTLAGTRGFRDHHSYSAADLASIRATAAAAGAEVIATTEKDAVKIDAPDIVAVRAEMVIPEESLLRMEALVRECGRLRPPHRGVPRPDASA